MGSGTQGLQQFFQEIVEPRFFSAGVVDRDVCSYVVQMLTDFVDGSNLHRIRDANGRPLQDVGEMLLESDPVYGPAPSFDREREVRKHIGDYTLFFTGMFPGASITFACASTGWKASSISSRPEKRATASSRSSTCTNMRKMQWSLINCHAPSSAASSDSTQSVTSWTRSSTRSCATPKSRSY